MAYTYTRELLEKAFTYLEYREHLNHSLRKSAVDEQEQKMRPYTEKNVGLMEKFDISYKVSKDLRTTVEVGPAVTWLVLTEGWCGDAAFIVPMLATIEKALPDKVKLKLLLRDENPELMDAHLTNGGRSIPKLIVLDKDLKELGSWGPRPSLLQIEMDKWKNEGLDLKQIIPKVQAWYEQDETESIQGELIELVRSYY